MMSRSRLVIAVCGLVLLISGTAAAVTTFSIDYQGPTAGLVTEGDILTPADAGILPPPTIALTAAALGIVPTGAGRVELDALSFGREPLVEDVGTTRWFFSVDEFAVGLPGVPLPSVTTEGAVGAMEASADVYVATTLAGAIAPPGLPGGVNAGFLDGNGGLSPFVASGLNLVEPNAPGPGVPDPGDNLDALDIDTRSEDLLGPVYFSLDSGFMDPLEGVLNTATAGANGFVGGDVLVTMAPGAGGPALYASAASLGLDALGTDVDDLDALVLWENGVAGYQEVTDVYSWLGASPTDMLLYSVRRGSAVVGTLDAIWAAPIEEGDILVPVFTGVAFVPGIFIPAEALGLATVRSGTAAGWGVTNPKYGEDVWADDLDALDTPEPATMSLLAIGGLGALIRRKRREK